MNICRKQVWCAIFVILAVVIFLAVPSGTRAEPFNPSKDLEHDIRILEAIIMADLSKFPLPIVKVVPEAEFNAYMEKVAKDARVPEQKFL